MKVDFRGSCPSGSILDFRIATHERAVAVRMRAKVVNRLKAHFAQTDDIVPSSFVRTEAAKLLVAKASLETPSIRGQAMRACLGDLDFQDAAIKDWEEAIGSLLIGLPAVDLIAKESPGAGKILGATIVAEAGDVRRFTFASDRKAHAAIRLGDCRPYLQHGTLSSKR